MGAIRVHEFISLDSVIDTPSWTFQFGFDPRMGEAIGRITMSSDGILLGRTTYEMFEPTWSKRTVEEDPGDPLGRVAAFRREPAARHVDASRRGALRQRRHLPETHPGVVSTAEGVPLPGGRMTGG
jgi:hypothetical protein